MNVTSNILSAFEELIVAASVLKHELSGAYSRSVLAAFAPKDADFELKNVLWLNF